MVLACDWEFIFLQRKHASDCTVFPSSPLKPASTECWLSAVMHTSEAHYSLFFLSPAPLPHPSNSVFSEQLSHSRLPSPNAVCTAWYGVSAFPTQTQKKTRLPVPQAKFEWSQNTWASSRQGSQIFVTLVSDLHSQHHPPLILCRVVYLWRALFSEGMEHVDRRVIRRHGTTVYEKQFHNWVSVENNPDL